MQLKTLLAKKEFLLFFAVLSEKFRSPESDSSRQSRAGEGSSLESRGPQGFNHSPKSTKNPGIFPTGMNHQVYLYTLCKV
jgi:hypothetical protein